MSTITAVKDYGRVTRPGTRTRKVRAAERAEIFGKASHSGFHHCFLMKHVRFVMVGGGSAAERRRAFETLYRFEEYVGHLLAGRVRNVPDPVLVGVLAATRDGDWVERVTLAAIGNMESPDPWALTDDRQEWSKAQALISLCTRRMAGVEGMPAVPDGLPDLLSSEDLEERSQALEVAEDWLRLITDEEYREMVAEARRQQERAAAARRQQEEHEREVMAIALRHMREELEPLLVEALDYYGEGGSLHQDFSDERLAAQAAKLLRRVESVLLNPDILQRWLRQAREVVEAAKRKPTNGWSLEVPDTTRPLRPLRY